MADEKPAAQGKAAAGDAYIANLEAAVAALRHLLVTLNGAPGTSPYTAAAVVKGSEALARLDEA
jgi:hypothetical protein